MGPQDGIFSFHDIKETFGWYVSTVHDCWEQCSRDGTASKRQGFRQPLGTIERKDSRIRCTAVAHRTASAADIQAVVGTTVTQQTIRNQIPQEQLRARRPVACIPLTPSHCRL
ncbi:HTH_Tnp_Tc3_2 domain-containing protein [Trichonephila clavipes]|nr:HTH_Tnp_Tc3_2 domain-containing protein [Trichonephila clavipes]